MDGLGMDIWVGVGLEHLTVLKNSVKEVFAIEKSVLQGNYQVLLCPGGTTETGLGREAGEVKIKKAAVIETNFFPGQGQTETFSQSALMIY